MPRWTEQSRSRQAELIRQWQPWAASTGARTDEGKQRSSRNAKLRPGTTRHAVQQSLEIARVARCRKTHDRKLRRRLIAIAEMITEFDRVFPTGNSF